MRPVTCPQRSQNAELTTAALVAAACKGDQWAWNEIMNRYQRLVASVVGTYRLQAADADDAAASTWLHAVESLPALRDPDRLGGWLRTIARRECLAVLRRTTIEEPADLAAVGLVDRDPGPEAVVVVDEVSRAIGHALADLSGRSRRLIFALFFEPEITYTQMAVDTGMPVGSIGPTRRRALGSMRVGLERAGFGPDALAA